jgi:hypothetical protein
MNCKNNSEQEIKRRIIIGNRCYYGMSKLMKSQLLKRKTECQSYKIVILCNRPNMLSLSDLGTATGSLERNNSISYL